MPARIQELFKDSISPTDKPMILLVYHEEMTMNYLRNIGVDTTRWRDLLKDLIMPENASRVCMNIAFHVFDLTLPRQGVILRALRQAGIRDQDRLEDVNLMNIRDTLIPKDLLPLAARRIPAYILRFSYLT